MINQKRKTLSCAALQLLNLTLFLGAFLEVSTIDHEILLGKRNLSMEDIDRILASDLKSEFFARDGNDWELYNKASKYEWSIGEFPSNLGPGLNDYKAFAKNDEIDVSIDTEEAELLPSEKIQVELENKAKKVDLNALKSVVYRNYDEPQEYKYNNKSKKDSELSTSQPLLRPYLACMEKINMSGYECRAKVNSWFGEENSVPLYNDEDMACFVISALPSMTKSFSDTNDGSLTVQPILPEMKVAEGTINSTLSDKTSPNIRFNAFLCPGYSGSVDIAKELEEIMIMTDLNNGGKRYSNRHRRRILRTLKMESLHEGATNINDRSFWSFLSKNEVELNKECSEFYSAVTSSISRESEFVTVTIQNEILKMDEETVAKMNSTAARCIFSILAGLMVLPQVCSIERVPNYEVKNTEAQWITQSGSEDYFPFFDSGLTGKGQVVSVSDSGLDVDNCYLWDSTGSVIKDGRIDQSRRKVVQYVAFADDKAESGSHGTHVVGTIAGRRAENGRTESTGSADGIARDAKVAFFDIGRSNGAFLYTPDDTTIIFEQGKRAGSYIHSASWGSYENNYGIQEREIDSYVYDNDDWLIVVAAGNSGKGLFRRDVAYSVGSPATAKNIISVGASHSEGSSRTYGMRGKDYIADFSSRGPTSDGRIKPEVVAPGYYVLSANSDPDEIGECDSSGGINYLAGTSMAAPVVSGSAALIRQYFVDGWYPEGEKPIRSTATNGMKPSGTLIKAILLNGGQPVVGVQNGYSTTLSVPYDNIQGFGRISLIDSLPLQGKNTLRLNVKDRKVIADGDTDSYAVSIDKNGGQCSVDSLSVTLVWNDPAAFSNCRRCVYNDLDLFIEEASGRGSRIYPNGLGRRDSINNAERIRLDNVKDGDSYIIKVQAFDLATATQKYSLAISGCLGNDSDKSAPIFPSPSLSTSTAFPTATPQASVLTNVIPTTDAPSRNNSESPISLESIETNFLGEYRQAGNMFNIRAERDIEIYSLDIHTSSTELVDVEVWTRFSSYRERETNSYGWIKVADGKIRGQGLGMRTPIPRDIFEYYISLKKGDIQGFYVTLKSAEMVYSSGTRDGAIAKSNQDISIGEGASKTYQFGNSYKPRVWNGAINYKVLG